MKWETQEPEERPGRQGTVYSHPAYGQISVSRVSHSHGAVLYGTDFRHRHYVQITIQRSEFERGLSSDWPHAGGELVRLKMSEAQWATMVSSLNMGGGVQCTLEHVGYERMPMIPYRDSAQEFQPEADGTLAKAVQHLKELGAEIQEETGKLPKNLRERLGEKVRRAIQDLESNLPFVSRRLGEHMETRVEKAKSEITAWATNFVMRAGLAHLQEKPPIALEDARGTEER